MNARNIIYAALIIGFLNFAIGTFVFNIPAMTQIGFILLIPGILGAIILYVNQGK